MNPTIRQQTPTRPLEFPARSFFLYGRPKTGKTTTAAAFPRPLILNALSENGTTQIAGDVVDISTPADLANVVSWFKTGKHEYQTIVLDGLTTFVLDEIARAGSKDTRRAVKDATGRLREPLHNFLALPCIRVLTGHAREEEEEISVGDKTAIRLNTYPDLPPRLRQLVEGRVDAFGYCYPHNGKSLIWWLPADMDSPRLRSIAAGNRLGLPKTTELSYAAIHAALVAPVNGGSKPVPAAPR